jgi:hypothetical protein
MCSSILVDDINLQRSTIMTRTCFISVIIIIVATTTAAIIVFFALVILFLFSAVILLSFRRRLWNFNALTAHLFLNQLKKYQRKRS